MYCCCHCVAPFARSGFPPPRAHWSPPCLRGLAQSAGDYALGSVKIVQVTTDTSCPWSSVGESGVRAALNAEGIGVLAVHDDRRIFGVNGHNYSHLVKILDGAGPSLHSAFAKSDDLYYQWAGFDPRTTCSTLRSPLPVRNLRVVFCGEWRRVSFRGCEGGMI